METIIQESRSYRVIAIRKLTKYGKLKSCNRITCFICGHIFNDNDNVYLGVFNSHRNEIICEECANILKE